VSAAAGGLAATRPSPDADAFLAAGLWLAETLDEPLRRGAATHPGRLALVDRERRFSYGELWERIERTAGMLAARGVGRGDVVSFQLPNWAEAAIVHHAVALLGAVSNPVIPIYRGHELGFILRQAGSRVLVVPDVFRRFDYRELAAQLLAECEALEHVLVVGEPLAGMESFAAAVEAAEPALAAERDPGEVVLLLYTSGTEANPKGVLHSHETLAYECRSIIELYRLSAEDTVFMPSPLTHITGLLYGVLLPFMLGTRVVLQDVWDPDLAVDLIEREGLTFTVGATPFLHGIVNAERRAESLRIFGCGGADVPPALIEEADRELGIRASRLYGSTECPTSTGTPIEAPVDRHATTDGAPIGADQLRIVDDDGAVLPPGERGELQVRGPDLCLGYLDPALNARAFTEDGWFRSGDLAIADEQGYLRIAGRAKDVILRGGENLSAKEIEDLLFEHPEVEEVAIVGYPDEVLGERSCAVVVAARQLELADLVSYLRSRSVANQKLPERLLQVEALPKTASGKVQKYRLRDELRAESAGP
jgi:cyclohexanecarboxylate-CoA ligase